MLIQAKRLERFLPSLVFPLPILAATSSEVVFFAQDESEMRRLMERGAVFAIGSRTQLKTIRFVNEDAQIGYVAEVCKESDPTRAIPSVDLEHSEAGHASYMMRRVTDDGQLVRLPEFRRAA